MRHSTGMLEERVATGWEMVWSFGGPTPPEYLWRALQIVCSTPKVCPPMSMVGEGGSMCVWRYVCMG